MGGSQEETGIAQAITRRLLGVPQQVMRVAGGVARDSVRLLSVVRLKIGTDELALAAHRNDGADAAVVLVHGFGSCDRTWGRLPALLTSESALDGWDLFSLGYDTGLSLDLPWVWSADPDIATLSTYLRTKLRLAPLDRYRAIALVAHSMGGLVVQRALVDDPALVDRTSHVLLYGTPSGGLGKARIGAFLKTQIRDMAVDSTFLTDLRSRWSEEFGGSRPFRFWTVAGDRDVFVPASSSLGPFPVDTQVVIPGNHLEMCSADRATDMSIRVLVDALVGEQAPGGPLNAARVAVEGREFRRAVELLLPHASELDDHHLVDLALALDEIGRREEAIELLRSHAATPDALGTLAGRLKRVWLAEGLRREAEDALDLYTRGFEAADRSGDVAEAAYHAINLAFLELTYRHDRKAAKTQAQTALELSRQLPQSMWRAATDGEACLYLGDNEAGLDHYRRAVEMQPTPRELRSMYAQASRVANELRDPGLASGLDDIFFQASTEGRELSTPRTRVS